MRKKVLALTLALILCLSLCSCVNHAGELSYYSGQVPFGSSVKLGMSIEELTNAASPLAEREETDGYAKCLYQSFGSFDERYVGHEDYYFDEDGKLMQVYANIMLVCSAAEYTDKMDETLAAFAEIAAAIMNSIAENHQLSFDKSESEISAAPFFSEAVNDEMRVSFEASYEHKGADGNAKLEGENDSLIYGIISVKVTPIKCPS